MNNIDISICLKVAGSCLSGLGSLLLAWRLRSIIQWITYSIVAHEVSLEHIQKILTGQGQSQPLVNGIPKHLLSFLDKTGFLLLIAGFTSLGIGMLLNMFTYLLKY